MKVAEHLITAPPTDQADHVGVNMGTQEGHSTGSTKGSGRDIGGKETKGRAQKGDGSFEGGRNVGRSDIMPMTICKIASKWGIKISIVGACMENAVAQADDRTELGVATVSKANDFALYTILLGCEGECGKGGRLDVSIGGHEKIKVMVANTKLDITELEGSGVTG